MTIKSEESKLSTIPLPKNEIRRLLDLHHSISSEDAQSLFDKITLQISYWLEQVHLSIFTLEQHVRQQEEYEIEHLHEIEEAMIEMDPIITNLSGDIAEIMYERHQQMKITKIQSEWSGVHHFVNSVKSQVTSDQQLKQLAESIDRLLFGMDDVSTMIFDFQEKKQLAVLLPVSSLSVTTQNDLLEPSASSSPWSQNSKDDHLLQEIDHAFEALMQQMEQIYSNHMQEQAMNPVILRRLDKLKEKWEHLQGERDELKQEHKEDRWLAVFKRVADQVDVMIDGLDRSATQCYSIVQQVREWQSKAIQQGLKSLQYHHTNIQPLPIDRDKFWSLAKSFEAKYKYYTPSIDRMLSMLGNGISARASRDNTTAQRHEAMLQRWFHLKEVMDELRLRDLVETERTVLSVTGTTSSSNTANSYYTSSTLIQTNPSSLSNQSSGWRYRTPEPSSHDYIKHKQQEELRTQSATPNSAYYKLGRSSPRQARQDYSPSPQSLLRTSLSDSSSVDSTPRHTKLKKQKGHPSIDFYEEDERDYGVDMMKPRRPPSSAATERKQPSFQSKTPTHGHRTTIKPTLRSKSSMGDLLHQRALSPSSLGQRSMTPSLIPRPKTPKDDVPLRRPKSQMQQRMPHSPAPPLPKHITTSKRDSPSPRLRKKASMKQVLDDTYHPDPKDPLDVEVAHIVNASPIPIQCQRGDQLGKYYFGNELSISSMGGKKVYTCKLMTYANRRGGQFKNNKVLIRVGGGWQDLEFFLLEHSSLMASDVVTRSFTAPTKASHTVTAGNGHGGWRS
ncbi:hypothetical protein BD560DRAFT_488465 [Blakeslea trispora]|nr:hypothetical protein BD560DRAFT_488465 [Blakeslea trispora]